MSTSIQKHPLPAPTLADVTVRPATLADVPFIDSLQKQHDEALGFMALSWLEEKIAKDKVLVAWASRPCSSLAGERMGETPMPREEPIGYVMGSDRYFKRDEVGIVYQLAVVAGRQRGFVGATLLKALFDASAYGCKLYCCWCAQDLDANRFWESVGFVPLAFRTGSHGRKKGDTRTHIFWQKRIRENDATTGWWYPAKTDAGALRADRLVFPIPIDKHWSDEMPVIVPSAPKLALDAPTSRRSKDEKSKAAKKPVLPMSRQFGGPSDEPEPVIAPKAEKPKREKKPKEKVDPKLVAAARELRDRYLEQVNDLGGLLPDGKYNVARALPATAPATMLPIPPTLLPAA